MGPGHKARDDGDGFPTVTTPSLDRQQLDLEDHRGVGGEGAAGAAGAVAELGRNDEGALAADLHRADALIPTADDLTLADDKLERLAAVERAVELLALGAVLIEPAGVVHDAGLTGEGHGAGADLGVRDL